MVAGQRASQGRRPPGLWSSGMIRRERPPGLGGHSLVARGEREREPRSQGGVSGSGWPQSGGKGREGERASQSGGRGLRVWVATIWRRGERGRESLAVRREGPPGLGGHNMAARGEREREPRSQEGGASGSGWPQSGGEGREGESPQ